MPDMSAFDDANIRPKSRPSYIQMMLDDLDIQNPDRAAAVRQALDDLTYTAPAISKVLESWGYQISTSVINKWRSDRR